MTVDKILQNLPSNYLKDLNERLVPFDNPESTLGLYLNLFKDTDIKEEQFLKVAVDLDVESAAKDYEDKLKAVMGDQPKADLLLLGKYLITYSFKYIANSSGGFTNLEF